MTIKVTYPGDTFEELYHHYQGQSSRQDIYLELDPEEKTLHFDWNGEIGKGVPMSVWNGTVIRYDLPHIPTTTDAKSILARVLPLAEEVVSGYHSEQDQNFNWKGYLNDDAWEASYAIENILEQAEFGVEVWEAEDWYIDSLPESLTLTSTDEEITSLAKEETATAKDQGAYVTDIEEFLLGYREHLQEEERE